MKMYDLNWRLEHHPLAEADSDRDTTKAKGERVYMTLIMYIMMHSLLISI